MCRWAVGGLGADEGLDRERWICLPGDGDGRDCHWAVGEGYTSVAWYLCLMFGIWLM